MNVIQTFPGDHYGEWLDLVCAGPGNYCIQIAGTDKMVAENFLLPLHAVEWVVNMQAFQRGWIRMT